MPIYEFACDACAGRFEALVPLGTESVACRLCGAEPTRRVLSAQAAPMHMVKSPGATRKQEGANARLRERTKADFKARRRRARESRGRKDGGA